MGKDSDGGRKSKIKPHDADPGQDADLPTAEPAPAFQPTKPEQLIWLAEQILRDPAHRKVIERVGIHGDLTDKEDQDIDAFIERCVIGQGWGKHHPFTLSLSVVVARRLTAGVFKRADSEEVVAFLEHNTMKQHPDYRATPKPHINEVLFFAKALRDDTTMCEIFETAENKHGFNDREDKLFLKYRHNFQKKYGLFNRVEFALGAAISLNRMLVRGEIDNFSSEKAMRFLRKHEGTVVSSCIFEGKSNV